MGREIERRNEVSASNKFGNLERIESISYVLVNDDYHLILIDNRPNKTIFELLYLSYSLLRCV